MAKQIISALLRQHAIKNKRAHTSSSFSRLLIEINERRPLIDNEGRYIIQQE